MHDPIALWHRAVATRDGSRLEEFVADDAVFFSPALGRPQAGKASVVKYLRAAIAALGNDSFRFTNEWRGPSSAVLEFEAEVDGIRINGVDMIHWNADGQIIQFKVMVRPFKALEKVIALMTRELGA